MFDRRGIGRVGGTERRTQPHGDLGSALLVVMAAAAILFVIAASVVGVVVFQQTQLSHAQAVTRSTALAQQGMEAYLTALRTDPDYWSTTPTIQGVGRDGTWTVAANMLVTPATITSVGRDRSSGMLHVIRVEVRLENFSDYTVVSGDPLTLGSGIGDISVLGNVRGNSTITLNKKFSGMNVYYASGTVINKQNADLIARVAPLDFTRIEGLFPGMYTAARSREPWGATNLVGDPTASQLEKSLAFYRDPTRADRNYWGADANNLSPVGSGDETDLVGVGVDFTNGADHATGLFYIRSVWPPTVSGPGVDKTAVSRKQFIDFARKDPTWNTGSYGDMEASSRSFSITPRGLNPNGNNVIYVGGDLDVYVKGEYARSVTIVSERDIYIIGNVTRASDAPTATLGLVAKRNIIICGAMPDTAGNAVYTLPSGEVNGYTGGAYRRALNNPLMWGETLLSPVDPTDPSGLKIQAAMMAVTGAVMMDPDDVTDPSADPPLKRTTDDLKISGSVIARKGLQGPNFANEYNAQYGGFRATRIEFDQQLQDTPPPLFPQIGAGALKVIRWDEYTTTVDPNEGLTFPEPGEDNGGGPVIDDGSELVIVVPPGGDIVRPVTIANAMPLYSGEAVITLDASDNPGGAGVWKTWYTVDNALNDDGTPKIFQGDTIELPTLPPNTAETRTVDFWSMDQAGNVETTRSATFRMVGRDTLPPLTTVFDSLNPSKALADGYPQLGDDEYVVYGDFKPKFTSVDTTEGLGAYMVWVVQDNDPSTAMGYDDPNPPALTIPYPPAGFVTRYFEYYGIDKSGNREQARTLTIKQHAPDMIAPTTFFDAQPSYFGDAVIHLTGIDDVEGQGWKDTWYQLDGGEWKQGRSNPTTVTVAAPARGSAGVSHTLKFYSRDVAPNVNKEATQTVMFTVLPPLPDDITPPFTTSDMQPTYVGPAVINLSSYDVGGVDYIFWSLDGGPERRGTRIEVTDPWSGSASHTITYGAVDKAGNVEVAKTETFVITPERIAPITSTHNLELYSGPAVFQLTAEDNVDGSGLKETWYKIDDGPYRLGTTLMGLTWVTVTGDGLHTVTYFSVDNARNEEAPKQTTLRIDTTAPVTSTDNVGSYAGQAVVNLTSTDTDGSGVKSIRWRNQANGFEQISNPVLLGPGTWDIDYWAIDNAGNYEAVKTFHVVVTALPDNAAPKSYDDIAPYYNRSASPAIINLYSWDVQSGVATMTYILDGVEHTLAGKGSPPASYQITVSGDSTHTLEYWASDKSGNVESPHLTKSFKVDTILPVTTCSARAGGAYWSTQTFTLSASDAGSGVKATYYSLDGAPTVKGTQVYVAAPTDSYSRSHVITYWSADAAGNVEYPAKTVSFVSRPEDAVAPSTFANVVAEGTDSVSLVLSAFDNLGGSGVEHTYYRIDSGPQVDGRIVTINGSGAHVLEYWSTDNAGNIEVHKTATFNVDGIAPTTTSDVKSVYNAAANIKLTATDNTGGSGVAHTLYRVDGGVVTTSTSAVTTVTVAGAGTHTLEFWSADLAGNIESPHKNASFKIDLVAPTTTSDAVGTYSGPASISLSAIDDTGGSGVAYTYYKIDTGARQTGTSFTVAAPASGAAWHTIFFWSVDNAGNTEAIKSATFQVTAVANMTFSGMTPAEFSTIALRNPNVSVSAAADQKILSAVATIDGIQRPVTLTNPGGYTVTQGYWVDGYWDYDDCDSWYVDGYWVDTSYWVPADDTKATATYSTSGLANGSHIAAVTFTNASGASKTKTWTFTVAAAADVIKPVTTCDAVAFYSAPATITLSASDEVGGMDLANTTYLLDGVQRVSTLSTTTIAVAAAGTHTLEYWSTDRAGNVEVHKTVTFIMDWVAPTTASSAVSNYAGTATVYLTATDNVGGSGVKSTYYAVDSGAASVPSIAPGTVGFWRLNEGAGSVAADSSGGGLTASVIVGSGGTQSTTAQAWAAGSVGRFDKALNLDGVDDYVNVGSQTALNNLADSFSVSAWVKTSVNTGTHVIAGRGNDWRLQKVGSTYVFEHRNASNVIVQPTATNTSTDWVHVAATFDSVAGQAKLYINGALVDTKAQTGTTRKTQTQNQIGNNYAWHTGGTYNDFYWSGQIDEVSFSNTARSAIDLQTYYAAVTGASAPPLPVVVPAPVSGPPVLHTVYFRSVDNAGNSEATKSVTFSVSMPPDVVAPTTTSNAVASYYRPSTITLTAVDNVGGWGVANTYSKLDGAGQLSGASPVTGGAGSHTLEYWSVDAAGNLETPHKFAYYTVASDAIAPTTVSNAVSSYVGTATIQLTATDNTNGWGVANTYYTVDSGTQQTGTTIVVAPPVGAPVTHSITFWSVDAAGNVESTKSATFDVEGAPVTMTFSGMTPAEGAMLNSSSPAVSVTAKAQSPIVSVTAKVDGVSYTPAITFGGGYRVSQGYWEPGYWDYDDCDSWWVDAYWVDTSYDVPGDNSQATASFATSSLASGMHTVSVTFIIGTGQRTTKTWTFLTDVAPPTTVSDAKVAYTGTASIKLTATDNFGGSGVKTTYYKLDTGGAVAGTSISVAPPTSASVEHTIYFWSVDNAGNIEGQNSATFVSNALPDTIAPTTSSNAQVSYAQPANITLTAVDNVGGWGVASVSYSLDNAATQTVTGSSAVVGTGGSGTHTLRFFAKDKANNTETPIKSVTYTVSTDLIAPTTTSNAQAAYTGPASITLTAVDNVGGWGVKGTYFKLDGGAITTGTLISVPDQLAGTVAHHIDFWSVDNAGNKETTKTADFTVAAIPASVTFSNVSPVENSSTKSTNPTVTVTGQAALTITGVTATLDGTPVVPTVTYRTTQSTTQVWVVSQYWVDGYWADDGCGGTYYVDGYWVNSSHWETTTATVTDYTNATVSFATSGLSNGTHTAAVTFTVTGGRASTKTWSFIVDTIAPTTTSSVVPTYTGPAAITLTPTDNVGGSGVATTYYKIDSGAFVVGTSTVVPAPTTGVANRTITFYSVDKAGNIESATSKTFVVKAVVDNTPPTGGWTGNNGGYYNYPTTWTINATDNAGGWGVQYIFYRLDGGPVTTGTVPFTLIGSGAEGPHTLEYWCVDFAGNSSAHTFVSWIVDYTAPVTTSNATDCVGTANITLTATDKIGGSGVAATYYRVDTGAQQTGTSISVAAPASGAPVSHTIYFWSVDRAGNTEATKSKTFTITPQTAAVTFTGHTPAPGSTVAVRNPSVSVVGQATGNIVSVSATLDGVAKAATVTYPNTYLVTQGYWGGGYWADDGCGGTYYVDVYWVNTSYWVVDNTKATATFPTTGLTDGQHTVVFTYAVSGQGQAVVSWTFNVNGPDTTAPTTTANNIPSYVGTATITLTPTDNAGGSGVKATYYKLDGGVQTTGTVVVVAPPAYGAAVAHAIQFWSVDNNGNTESAKTIGFTVAPSPDTIAPTTTSNATSTYTGTALITLNASDNIGGWGLLTTSYKVDDGITTNGLSISVAPPIAFSAVHHIDFWSTDRANNVEAAKTATFTINALPDGIAPTTTSNALSVYPAPSTITLSGVDNVGGWGVAYSYYRLDGGAVTTGTTPPTGGEGSHVLEFWSVDKAGNTESPHKFVAYKVDMTAPTTMSNAVGAYAGSATIVLTPSDNVGGSGVRYTYYRIDGGVQQSGTATTVPGPTVGLPVQHTMTFWSVDWAGIVESAKTATFTISPPADNTPPTTSSNATAFYGGPSSITLTSADNTGGWGVDKVYYALDGAAVSGGAASPVTVATGGNGSHTLQFWATDLAGNREATKTVSYNVDMTAPTSSADVAPSYTGTATITITAVDNLGGAGVKYIYSKVDGGTAIVGATVKVPAPAYGTATHTIEYYAVDNVNNTESPMNSAVFTVSALPDSTKPTTTSNALAVYSSPATITLTATDNLGGWGVKDTYYRLDGGSVITGTAPITLVGTGLGGDHTLEFWSIDRATNEESPHKTVSYYVTPDTTAPVTTSNAVGYYIGAATITLSATDSGWGVAGTYYKIDGGATQTGLTIPITAPVAGSANHTIEFWSIDKASNVETPHKTVSFTVDAVPATVTFSLMSPTAGSTVTTGSTVVSVKAVADKNITAVSATIDGNAATTTNSITTTSALSSFTATGLTNGTHTVAFTVTNSVGAQATKTWTFNVAIQTDFVPPTTTSNSKNQYFGSASITLAPADNPGGSGVKYTYYKIDGGAQTAGTAITIAGPTSGLPVSHTITYWSVDNVGNVEVPNSATFTIAIPDTIAPTTTSNALAAYLAPGTIMLTGSDNDGGSGVAHTYYRLDGGAITEGTILGSGGAGSHVLEFWSVDNSGNIESPHKTVSYKVDLTAPVTTSNAQLSYTGAANITLTPTDNSGGSGVKFTYYKVDDGGQTSGTSINIAPPTFASVTHTIYFWSVDNAGNIETTKSATFSVAAPADTTAPTTISDRKSVYAVPGLITLTATDNFGGWGVADTFYRLDGAAVAKGTAIRTGGVGSHTLEYWSVDRADNIELPHTTITYSVTAADTAKPVTTSDALTSYVGTAKISLTATDNCGVTPTTFYRVDAGAETTGTSISVPAPRGGSVSHTIYFWSVDINGNVEVAKSKTFTVSAVPANMTFSGMTPAEGSKSYVRNPNISVTAQDTQIITDGVIEIDGIERTTSVILNNTLASASVSSYGLADGQHSVTAAFTNALGATSTKTWSFIVDAPLDVTAPVTSSNGVAAYAGTAQISISASDEAGGMGVAYTYYKLDGGVQLTGTAPNTNVSVAAAGSHTIEFWSVDLAGNQEWPHKTVTFNVDLTPPTTLSNAQTAYNTPMAEITLNPQDNSGGSGIKTTYYRVDTGQQQSGTLISVPAPTSGATGVWHTVYFWSVDNAGNVEATRSATFKSWAVPDTTAPVTTSDAAATYAVQGIIHLTATDNAGGWGVANTFYVLDGGAQTTGTIVPTGGPGNHTLEFWSVDLASNVETPHKTVTYAVTASDAVAPTTVSNAAATYPLGTGQINLTATDNAGGSGVAHTYYRWDDGPQTESTMIGVSGEGEHHVDFWSVDWAGNAEAPKRVTFTVTAPDLTAPTTTSNALASYAGTATVTLTPTDNVGGVGVRTTFYRLDSGPVQTGTTLVIAPPVTGTAPHTILFWSVDNAGNTEDERSVAFSVLPVPDTIAPTTSSNAVAAYTGQATITLTAADNTNGSGVKFTYYRVDSGAQQTGTSIVVAPPASGTVAHRIDYWSVDNAGNIETAKVFNFNVTAAAAGNATLSFSWDGYGEADLHVENAAGVTIASTYVSGSGSDLSWQVTVPAGQAYYMVCDWYDDWDYGGSGGGYGVWSSVMPVNGNYHWSY